MTPHTDREAVAALLQDVQTMRSVAQELATRHTSMACAAQTIDRLQLELMAALLEVEEENMQ
jgi:hypothetical protein